MIITQTPLRVSLVGGGTDFRDFYKKYGGCVVTTAIDKYVYCIIKKRFDKKIYVNYSQKEIVDSVEEIKHELVRESMKKVGVQNGVEISFLSDIPSAGSGLGSSSSVTVGVLNALYHYIGYTPNSEKLAKEACEVEIDVLKKPIGVQDQYIAAFGGLRFIEFKRSGEVSVSSVLLDDCAREDLDNYLMLFYTGVTRQAETILGEQKSNIPRKEKSLQKMCGLSIKARKLLEKGDVLKLGNILDRSWQIKKRLASKVTNVQIDELYSRAKDAGALGGKISGAGGGGFLTLFVPTEKRSAVRRSLKGLQEMPFRLARDGSKVIFNSGT